MRRFSECCPEVDFLSGLFSGMCGMTVQKEGLYPGKPPHCCPRLIGNDSERLHDGRGESNWGQRTFTAYSRAPRVVEEAIPSLRPICRLIFADDPLCPSDGVLGNYPPIRRDNRAKVRQAPVAKGLEAYCGFQLDSG